MELAGKHALITGAASGIGRATAIRLAAEGCTVACVDWDLDGATAVAAEIGGHAFRADCGDPAEIDRVFGAAEEMLGGLDIVFLNAGIAIGVSDISALTDEDYTRIMRVNVDGVVYGTRAAIRALERRGGGAIIATASLAGIIPFPPDPVYDATKHAVVGFIRSVAETLAPRGILANTVNPGMTDTNILNEETKDFFARIDFPLMPATQIAQAIVDILEAGRHGECWVCQPGREATPYRFGQVPGPRGEAAGKVPPNGLRDWATGRGEG